MVGVLAGRAGCDARGGRRRERVARAGAQGGRGRRSRAIRQGRAPLREGVRGPPGSRPCSIGSRSACGSAGKTERARDVYRSYLKAAGPARPSAPRAEARLAELEGQRAPAPRPARARPSYRPGRPPARRRCRDARGTGLGRYRAATVRVFAVARPTCEPFGYSSRCFPLLAHGSGLLFRSGGNVFVLTNRHVARAEENDDDTGKGRPPQRTAAPETVLAVQVPNDARYFPARPVYQHPTQDVAVLRLLAAPGELPALREVAVIARDRQHRPRRGADRHRLSQGVGAGRSDQPGGDLQRRLEGVREGKADHAHPHQRPRQRRRVGRPGDQRPRSAGGHGGRAHRRGAGPRPAHPQRRAPGDDVRPAAGAAAGRTARSTPPTRRSRPRARALNKYIEYFFQHQNMAAADKQAETAKRLLETAVGANPAATDAHLLVAWLDWARVRLHAERMTKDDSISDDDFKQKVRADYRAACPDIIGHLQEARLERARPAPGRLRRGALRRVPPARERRRLAQPRAALVRAGAHRRNHQQARRRRGQRRGDRAPRTPRRTTCTSGAPA